MDKRLSATLVALAVCVGAPSMARAQAKDSTPTFSIFGGTLMNGAHHLNDDRNPNLEFGGSADFRLKSFPLPLRATMAFRQEEHVWSATPMKFGTLSLDVVGKPVPRIFGLQPYLLGGLGLATRANYVEVGQFYGPNSESPSYYTRSVPRQTWAFAEGGIGLELGRHLFVQTKLMMPVASQGPVLMPVSVGFRFWDD